MDIIVRSNRIDTIIASEICTPYSQMVHFDIQRKVEYDMEFGAIDQDQVVNSCVDWRYQSDKSRALSAVVQKYRQQQNRIERAQRPSLLIEISVDITLSLNSSKSRSGIKFKINSCKR